MLSTTLFLNLYLCLKPLINPVGWVHVLLLYYVILCYIMLYSMINVYNCDYNKWINKFTNIQTDEW